MKNDNKKLEVGDKIRITTPNKMSIYLDKSKTIDVVIYNLKTGEIYNNQDNLDEIKTMLSEFDTLNKRVFHIIKTYKVDGKILVKLINNNNSIITVPLEFISKFIDTHPTVRAFKMLLKNFKRGKKYINIHTDGETTYSQYSLRAGNQVEEIYEYTNTLNTHRGYYNIEFEGFIKLISKDLDGNISQSFLLNNELIRTLINSGEHRINDKTINLK